MARYTDIDLLIETVEETDWYHINKNGELCRGANSKDDVPLYKHSDIKEVLNNAPIDDVIPKSEVKFLRKTITKNAQKALETTLEEVEKAKAEVVWEIFKEMDGITELFAKGLIGELEMYDQLAELKKKYIVEVPIVRSFAEVFDRDTQSHLEK
jgi:hypothetical protein